MSRLTRRHCARSFLPRRRSPVEAPSHGVPAWWRIAALLMAIVAAGEGGFIAWRLASSPSGLLGTNGTLKVESKPMGAQVKIDGEVRGITPLSLSIAGGAHVMEIAAGTEPRVIPITRHRRADALAVRGAGRASPRWAACRFSRRRSVRRCCSTASPEA